MELERNAKKGIAYTVNALEAQYKALLFSFFPAILLGSPYWLIPGTSGYGELPPIWIIVITIIGGIVVHELIHGITWAFFSENGLHSIKFGVIWKVITPYCHCTEALNINHYRAGTIMPGIILGVLPIILATVFGSFVWYLFGMLFLIAAGGDFMMLWMLRKVPPEKFALDHPKEVGCLIYETKQFKS